MRSVFIEAPQRVSHPPRTARISSSRLCRRLDNQHRTGRQARNLFRLTIPKAECEQPGQSTTGRPADDDKLRLVLRCRIVHDLRHSAGSDKRGSTYSSPSHARLYRFQMDARVRLLRRYNSLPGRRGGR